jgi:hypothetical protein
MAFFDDFATAMSGYPAASVTLTIGSLAVVIGTNGAINVNEVWRFTVTVHNNGNLNMRNVALHLSPQNGAQLGTASTGPFSANLLTTTTIESVPAKGSASTGYYYFKAPAAATSSAVALVEAHLSAWDANLDYLLNNLTGHASPPEMYYSAQVFP